MRIVFAREETRRHWIMGRSRAESYSAQSLSRSGFTIGRAKIFQCETTTQTPPGRVLSPSFPTTTKKNSNLPTDLSCLCRYHIQPCPSTWCSLHLLLSFFFFSILSLLPTRGVYMVVCSVGPFFHAYGFLFLFYFFSFPIFFFFFPSFSSSLNDTTVFFSLSLPSERPNMVTHAQREKNSCFLICMWIQRMCVCICTYVQHTEQYCAVCVHLQRAAKPTTARLYVT